MTVRRYASRYERLVANTIEDEDGCWIWQGGTNDGRYPVLAERKPGKAHPVKTYAHRAMLEEVTGFLFPFDEAGHYRCFKPLCIRPEHLRIETQAENLSSRRGYAPCQGRWIPVLYPTPAREMADTLDDFLDRALAHWA